MEITVEEYSSPPPTITVGDNSNIPTISFEEIELADGLLKFDWRLRETSLLFALANQQ